MSAYSEAMSYYVLGYAYRGTEKGIPTRSEAVGTLSSELFKMSVSEEMRGYLEDLGQKKDSLNPIVA